MEEQRPANEIVLPQSGELINLEDERQVALAYREVAALDRKLYEAKIRLREALGERARVLGTKTMYIDGVGKVEVRGGEVRKYDEMAIESELRKANCPEEIIREIVVEIVSWQVDAKRAARAARANPEYAEIIARHTTVVEKTPSISITPPPS